jgi:hypothetical protein
MTHQDLERTVETVQDLTAEHRGLAKEFGRKKSRISKINKGSRQLMQIVSHEFIREGMRACPWPTNTLPKPFCGRRPFK